MREQKYEFDMINTGKHPDVEIREKIHVSVLALNHMKAIKKAEWQNPCFRVAP